MSSTVDLELLFRAEYPHVVNACRRILAGDSESAEEVAQEAFLRAFERQRTLRGHPNPAGWVQLTATRIAWRRVDRGRRLSRAMSRMGEEPESPNPSIDDRIATRDGVAALPKRQRDAVMLRYMLGYNVAAVAEILGVSEGTVKTHLSRARQRLGELLEPPSNSEKGRTRATRQ